MGNIYRVDWKYATNIKRGGLKDLFIVFLVFLIIFILIIIKGVVDSDMFLAISFTLFSLFTLGCLLYIIKSLNDFEKYSVVKYAEIRNDCIKVTTIKNLVFTIKYEDIGLIINYFGVKYMDNIINQSPCTIFIYYNKNLGKCIELYFDRKVGEIIINKYRRYCKEKKIKPCPILEGVIESSEIVRQAVGKLMESSFCNRKNIKYDGYEMYGRIPPPPWLEGGNEDGGQIQ